MKQFAGELRWETIDEGVAHRRASRRGVGVVQLTVAAGRRA
ncbi:MAG: hypothetical protein ACT4P2_05070 [Pseudomonadota bacterium]